MNYFLTELQRRNQILYWLGWIFIISFFIGLFISISDDRMVNGFSIWNTPLKYMLSTSITIWTFGWILEYLRSKSLIRLFSWLIAISLSTVNIILSYRAIRLSENFYPSLNNNNQSLYFIMLLMIAIYSVTFILITIAFFQQKKMPISQHYSWGIRMSLLCFLFIIITGGIMLWHRSHNFGGADTENGMILFNFSTRRGDIRVPHFMALHALQIIPILSYYLFNKKYQVVLFSVCYMLFTLTLLIMALLGMPFISVK